MEAKIRKQLMWTAGLALGTVAVGGVAYMVTRKPTATSKPALQVPAPSQTTAVTLLADNQSVSVPVGGSLGIYLAQGSSWISLSDPNGKGYQVAGAEPATLTIGGSGNAIAVWKDQAGAAHSTVLAITALMPPAGA